MLTTHKNVFRRYPCQPSSTRHVRKKIRGHVIVTDDDNLHATLNREGCNLCTKRDNARHGNLAFTLQSACTFNDFGGRRIMNLHRLHNLVMRDVSQRTSCSHLHTHFVFHTDSALCVPAPFATKLIHQKSFHFGKDMRWLCNRSRNKSVKEIQRQHHRMRFRCKHLLGS